MYIRRVELKNIRCFEDVCIDLSSGDEARMWTLILGDNGAGKTTFLRSVAMGIRDESSAAALLGELNDEWIRLPADPGKTSSIRVEFTSDGSVPHPFIETAITKTASGEHKVEQQSNLTPSLWNALFVCGYGAGRAGFAVEGHRRYSALNAVYSLFNYEATLQNPELSLLRLERMLGKKRTQKILNAIARILELPEGSIRIDPRQGLAASGPWDRFVPYGGLGDGHHATLAWLCDMFGWALLLGEPTLQRDLRAVVLLDELEQHLHPSWQRDVVGLLARQFPQVQFIASTHSPLCVMGAGALDDGSARLVAFQIREKRSVVLDIATPPRDSRADQVLTSYLFGLESAWSDGVVKDIARYSALKSRAHRNSKDEQELKRLYNLLSTELRLENAELEQLVAEAVRRALENLSAQATEFDPDVIDFEMKRQLRGLFGYGRSELLALLRNWLSDVSGRIWLMEEGRKYWSRGKPIAMATLDAMMRAKLATFAQTYGAHIEPQEDAGLGPCDYVFSRGEERVLIELSPSYGDWRQGISARLPSHMVSQVPYGLFVVFDFEKGFTPGADNLDELLKLRDDVCAAHGLQIDVAVIGADKSVSASTRRRPPKAGVGLQHFPGPHPRADTAPHNSKE